MGCSELVSHRQPARKRRLIQSITATDVRNLADGALKWIEFDYFAFGILGRIETQFEWFLTVQGPRPELEETSWYSLFARKAKFDGTGRPSFLRVPHVLILA